MFRNKSVNVHHFSMVPRADVPRSAFKIQFAHKTTFDAGYLIPVFLMEVYPGDSIKCRMTALARLSTPLFPTMDNLHLESFFFYTPDRLVWDNFVKMMGEQRNPGDSISFTVPQVVCPAGGYAINSLQDYFGLMTVGQVGVAASVSHSTLPLRMYNLIWREWFRAQDFQNSPVVDVDDGPDNPADYVLLRRGKRHDYFTSCLPAPQKGSTAVGLPLGTVAPVKAFDQTNALRVLTPGDAVTQRFLQVPNNATAVNVSGAVTTADRNLTIDNAFAGQAGGLYADLTAATAATIEQLRQAIMIQSLLERDARGGTRYVESMQVHFGVRPPDLRLHRPEYLGGGSSLINMRPIPQTSGTGLDGGTTALATLAGVGSGVASGHGFNQSFSEHGYIIGLVNIRADLSYQQGVDRHWFRTTRYDFYYPAFAQLGEQAVLKREIYCDGSATDDDVFGYQEHWSELRYMPSKITGLFRSTAASTIDPWHYAQEFSSVPSLNAAFIADASDDVVSRSIAIGSSADGKQFIFDSVFDVRAVRALPVNSIPATLGRF